MGPAARMACVRMVADDSHKHLSPGQRDACLPLQAKRSLCMKRSERGTPIRTCFGPLIFVIIATIGLAITPAVVLAQVEVSGQVTVSRSGLVFNRATHTYDLT